MKNPARGRREVGKEGNREADSEIMNGSNVDIQVRRESSCVKGRTGMLWRTMSSMQLAGL